MIRKTINERMSVTETTPLFELIDLSQYECYLRISDYKATGADKGAYTVYGNATLHNKIIENFGINNKIYDLDGDGDVDIMDLILNSSNLGKENTELDLGFVMVGNQYSSHWEFSYDPILYVDGLPLQNNSGFMEKSQGDEVDVEPEFQTVAFLVNSKDDNGKWVATKYFYINNTF